MQQTTLTHPEHLVVSLAGLMPDSILNLFLFCSSFVSDVVYSLLIDDYAKDGKLEVV